MNAPQPTVRSAVQGRRALLFAVGIVMIVAGGLACWYFIPYPRYATIRLANPDQQVSLDAFPRGRNLRNPRTIATISTCFTRSTWLVTEVYAVNRGKVTLVEGRATGRSSELSRPGDPYLMTFPVTFGLADDETSDGQTTYIKNRGGSRSIGNFGGTYSPFPIVTSRTLTGRINPGEERLLYVEGDRAPSAEPEMTIDGFAAENAAGHFLVVTLKLDRG